MITKQKPEPINPWLAELIMKYRNRRSDDGLREGYRLFCQETPDKSWEDYLAERALLEESIFNPFILTEVEECDLPDELKTFLSLYCAVANVADILQITVEEFKELMEDNPQDLAAIEKFLGEPGLHLYHCDGFTYKISFPEE